METPDTKDFRKYPVCVGCFGIIVLLLGEKVKKIPERDLPVHGEKCRLAFETPDD